MKKTQFPSWHDDLKEQLKNPEFKAGFDEEYEKLAVVYQLVMLRNKNKLTQKQFAEKLKVSQAAVARMEGGEQNLTIGTLRKIGKVFGKKLSVKFV